MTEPRLQKRFLDCKGMELGEAEALGRELTELQRDIMWWIADLARYAEARWPETHYQIWPEWVSPGLLARATGVGKAYPKASDRQHDCTYTQYMQNAGRPDRQQRLREIVEKGQTTDESARDERAARWLLAFDIHYFAHRHFYSGAGVETAMQVSEWVKRTVERLKQKGATDVLCAFEGIGSFRKTLTAGWEHQYKDRPAKPDDLLHQLRLVRALLEQAGFACVAVSQYEADDVLASGAKQFPGKTTIISADKDLRQCLGQDCNILLDVEWVTNDTSGELLPDFKWLTAKAHIDATGIRPDQWADYQALMGDNVDGVQGAAGIGQKGAADLIKTFGTAEAVIEAAAAGDERIKANKRESLLEFERRLEVTRRLVTLRTDLTIATNTRI
jgi:5'-3' exonuclease